MVKYKIYQPIFEIPLMVTFLLQYPNAKQFQFNALTKSPPLLSL